jgi:hypothetical protein
MAGGLGRASRGPRDGGKCWWGPQECAGRGRHPTGCCSVPRRRPPGVAHRCFDPPLTASHLAPAHLTSTPGRASGPAAARCAGAPRRACWTRRCGGMGLGPGRWEPCTVVEGVSPLPGRTRWGATLARKQRAGAPRGSGAARACAARVVDPWRAGAGRACAAPFPRRRGRRGPLPAPGSPLILQALEHTVHHAAARAAARSARPPGAPTWQPQGLRRLR